MLDEATKERRKRKMTSSRIAAALGHDPDKSPIAVWEEILGIAKDFEGNKLTDRGDILENTVLKYGADVCGAKDWYVPPLQEHANGWAADSCDAIYTDDWGEVVALAEGKTVGMGVASQYGQEGTDQVPRKVLVQACWHLLHYPAAPRAVVPILVGGYEFVFKHFVIERNNEWLGLLMQDAEKWYLDHVVGERRPPVTAKDSDWLKDTWPHHEDRMLDPDEDFNTLVGEILTTKAELKVIEEKNELLCNQLRERLGHAAGVKGETWSVSYRNDKDSLQFDPRGVAAYLGMSFEEMKAKFSKLKEGPRKLRVTALKAKKEAA